eukprot:7383158-Prymnesium_polylepis.2
MRHPHPPQASAPRAHQKSAPRTAESPKTAFRHDAPGTLMCNRNRSNTLPQGGALEPGKRLRRGVSSLRALAMVGAMA